MRLALQSAEIPFSSGTSSLTLHPSETECPGTLPAHRVDGEAAY